MKTVLWIFLVILFSVMPAFAQGTVQIEATAYGGAPVYDSLKSAFCCTTGTAFVSYRPDSASYVAGLSSGVVLNDRLHVTFGAVYMPVSFVRRSTTCCPIANPETTEHGTSWEFPLLADYRWLKGSVRPFSGGGLILVSRLTRGPDQAPAPVVSGGVEWVHNAFAIRPEVRYIYSPQRPGSDVAVQRPENQFQILIGFTFRTKPL